MSKMDHEKLTQVLLNLDRCVHGRHHTDKCLSCPSGVSEGNPHMRPGTVIGYTVHAEPIVMPTRWDKTDPEVWYQPDKLARTVHDIVAKGDGRVITWICERCDRELAGNPRFCPHCAYTVYRIKET